MRRGWVRDNLVHVQSNYKSLVKVGTTGERERVATARHPLGRHLHTCTYSERRSKGLSNLKWYIITFWGERGGGGHSKLILVRITTVY